MTSDDSLWDAKQEGIREGREAERAEASAEIAQLIVQRDALLGACIQVRARMQGYRISGDAARALDRVNEAIKLVNK